MFSHYSHNPIRRSRPKEKPKAEQKLVKGQLKLTEFFKPTLKKDIYVNDKGV
jgi:hypothetical protein